MYAKKDAPLYQEDDEFMPDFKGDRFPRVTRQGTADQAATPTPSQPHRSQLQPGAPSFQPGTIHDTRAPLNAPTGPRSMRPQPRGRAGVYLNPTLRPSHSAPAVAQTPAVAPPTTHPLPPRPVVQPLPLRPVAPSQQSGEMSYARDVQEAAETQMRMEAAGFGNATVVPKQAGEWRKHKGRVAEAERAQKRRREAAVERGVHDRFVQSQNQPAIGEAFKMAYKLDHVKARDARSTPSAVAGGPFSEAIAETDATRAREASFAPWPPAHELAAANARPGHPLPVPRRAGAVQAPHWDVVPRHVTEDMKAQPTEEFTVEQLTAATEAMVVHTDKFAEDDDPDARPAHRRLSSDQQREAEEEFERQYLPRDA